jgi:hypothetical protein
LQIVVAALAVMAQQFKGARIVRQRCLNLGQSGPPVRLQLRNLVDNGQCRCDSC